LLLLWQRGPVMAGSPSFLLRSWRLYLGHNPFARPWDRAERVLVVLAVLVALTGIPFAATVGSETVARGLERAHEESSTRHPSVAVTLAETPGPVVSAGEGPGLLTRVGVAATWVAPDGAQRVGIVAVVGATTVGSDVPIWVDDAGNQASPPFTPADAVAAGVADSFGTWAAILVPLTGSCWLAHVVLNRLRFARWKQEWERFGRNSSYS
jgi:hypothetical protein